MASTSPSLIPSSHTLSDTSPWPANALEESPFSDSSSPRRKKLRTTPPSPPASPSRYDGPSSDDEVYQISSVFQGPQTGTTPSSPQDIHFSSGSHYLPTPPSSEHGEDTEDLAYPIHPRPLLYSGQTLLPGKARGRDLYRREYITASPNSASSASPDRFISNRSTPQTSARSFRLGKAPHLLSLDEKLLRRDSATPDPFVSTSPGRARQDASSLTGYDSRAAIRSQSRSVSGPDILIMPHHAHPPPQPRGVSAGAVWNIGGGSSHPTGPIRRISNGRGGFIGSGTNAPFYTAKFLDKNLQEDNSDTYEHRLAIALDIDRNRKVLDFSHPQKRERTMNCAKRQRAAKAAAKKESKPVPTIPFRVLDAPQLRDDYYCSALSYCHTSRTLAVGLGSRVYLWSEAFGVRYPQLGGSIRRSTYVTSLSFSSTEGGQSILAIGRNTGQISLWGLLDEGTRFESQQPSAVACLSFKPVLTPRTSTKLGKIVSTEELLVGDELGNVYYYAIEWVDNLNVDIHGWHGSMVLIAKISVHSQQICGLAWSPEGDSFATGANDNACCLFIVKDILAPQGRSASQKTQRRPLEPLAVHHGLPDVLPSEPFRQRITSLDSVLSSHLSDATETLPVRLAERVVSNPYILRAIPGQNGVRISEGRQKHKWIHSAAIKAIAFCPWQPGLLATGGGSNDRAIHFYHTSSGACLATINVQAQVTSLIWSTSRHEIAATFGYAQPEHPYRIAVFSWPECRQVVAIPWAQDMRALHAIAYPGGPSEKGKKAREGEAWWSRTNEEGCIVVACSDESVKFHEVWTGKKKSIGIGAGLLGGSDILEALEGYDKDDVMTIR
ncbi:MAG: hypothetical protein Q9200_003654 [Gallowayella weberi]